MALRLSIVFVHEFETKSAYAAVHAFDAKTFAAAAGRAGLIALWACLALEDDH